MFYLIHIYAFKQNLNIQKQNTHKKTQNMQHILNYRDIVLFR